MSRGQNASWLSDVSYDVCGFPQEDIYRSADKRSISWIMVLINPSRIHSTDFTGASSARSCSLTLSHQMPEMRFFGALVAFYMPSYFDSQSRVSGPPGSVDLSQPSSIPALPLRTFSAEMVRGSLTSSLSPTEIRAKDI